MTDKEKIEAVSLFAESPQYGNSADIVRGAIRLIESLRTVYGIIENDKNIEPVVIKEVKKALFESYQIKSNAIELDDLLEEIDCLLADVKYGGSKWN